ncbi:MAG: selenium cofactor biosynthesis protein YqeC [Syntrophorhabdaceae bacterium]|nr:selenium cofactor biosynthesis protein YqeC [Syntrophorhabdaceae bacterium]
MWLYQSKSPLESLNGLKFISFIGAGGKTSFIKYLARELSKKGEKVAITTTTKIYAEEPYIIFRDGEGIPEDTQNPVMIGKAIKEGKLTALNEEEVEFLGTRFDRVLIEADGAKKKPIKFPAYFEPVIPALTDKVFVLCGLDCLFKRIDDVVFRWRDFCDTTGISHKELISPDIFLKFFSKDCLLKGIDKKDYSVVLNKYDICEDRDILIDMAKNIIRRLKINELYISSLAFRLFYRVNYCLASTSVLT